MPQQSHFLQTPPHQLLLLDSTQYRQALLQQQQLSKASSATSSTSSSGSNIVDSAPFLQRIGSSNEFVAGGEQPLPIRYELQLCPAAIRHIGNDSNGTLLLSATVAMATKTTSDLHWVNSTSDSVADKKVFASGDEQLVEQGHYDEQQQQGSSSQGFRQGIMGERSPRIRGTRISHKVIIRTADGDESVFK
jgi:hypothetical protein